MIVESQYQLDYKVAATREWLRLLTYRDLLLTDVSREYSMATQSVELVDRAWSHHRARGNASLSLSWQSLVAASSPAECEREMALHVQRMLVEGREGELRLSSAFYGSVPSLVQVWDAVLTAVSHRLLWSGENPEEVLASSLKGESSWGAMQYEFTLTNPRNA